MKQTFLDKHGPAIGALICSLSALLMIAAMVISVMLVAPDAIDGITERAHMLTAALEVTR